MLFVLIFFAVRYYSLFTRGLEVVMLLGSWGCKWGVKGRDF